MPSLLARNAAVAALGALTGLGATACTGGSAEDTGSANRTPGVITTTPFVGHVKPVGHPQEPHAEWTYGGSDGPAHWAGLSAGFRTCRTGERQSPIDLGGPHTAAGAAAVEELLFDYRPVTAELVNTGHTIQANVSAGSRIVIGTHPYALTQFHFHLPSEHTLRGAHTSMELHLVHADADGALAVVAVLLAPGPGRSAFAGVLSGLPDEAGATRRVAGQVDLTTFLPANRDRYEYRGSLTTPPCTEGVRWSVLMTPSAVAVDEVGAYRRLFPKSNRPTQPRRGRQIAVVRD